MSEQPPRPEDTANRTTGPAYPAYASAPVQHRAAGLAIAALVLGIIGLFLAIFPFLCFVAFLPAVAAVVTGVMALGKRTTRRGMGLTGLILGGVGILVALVMTVVSIFFIVHIAEAVHDEQSSGGFSDGSSSGSPFGEDTDEDTDALPETAGPFVEGYVVRGSGEDVVPIGSVDGDTVLGVASVRVTGGSSFEIYGRDADGEDVEWVTDGQGDYAGDVVFNTLPGDAITAFHITGDADWTIELHSTDSVGSITSDLGGTGDDVLYYDGSATSAAVSCTSGTAISVWSEFEGTLIEGEPCPYSGTIELPAAGGLLQILATGDWTFAPVVDII